MRCPHCGHVFVSTNSYELAEKCLEMSIVLSFQRSTPRVRTEVAKALGLSGSYVSNLVRAMQRCSPKVLSRWREECNDEHSFRYLATDTLSRLASLTHDEQDRILEQLLKS